MIRYLTGAALLLCPAMAYADSVEAVLARCNASEYAPCRVEDRNGSWIVVATDPKGGPALLGSGISLDGALDEMVARYPAAKSVFRP